MYKIVSFRYESVIPKNFARLCRAKFFLPPQSQIRSYGLEYQISFTAGNMCKPVLLAWVSLVNGERGIDSIMLGRNMPGSTLL